MTIKFLKLKKLDFIMKCRTTEEHKHKHDSCCDKPTNTHFITVIISGIFTGLSFLIQWQNAPAYGEIACAIIAIIAGAWFIFPKAIRSIYKFSLDMNVLMSVAVIGAACINEWVEAATVVFLFSLSELLESLSVTRARNAIQSLLELSPEKAWLKDGDRLREVLVEEIKINSTIIIKSGAKIALDGKIISGNSTVNQSPITGESMPVEKKVGDMVFAGTINNEGSLEILVTKAYADTTLSRIIHLVEEAQSQKAPTQQFVDTFARYYTPTVFVLALLVWLIPTLVFGMAWSVWTYRALILLVIACPCALVIATPVSIVSGLTAMARRGVLIKGGAYLEAIGKLKALAVDKTGTITEARPKVIQVIPFSSKSTIEIVQIAAAIDIHSEHPLAQAVIAYAKEQGIEFTTSQNYQDQVGRGAQAEINGHHYFLGNHRFTHELAVCSEALEQKLREIETAAQSVVVVGHKPHADCAGEVLGIISIGDSIRLEAKEAIDSLHKAGINKVVMLSGDNQLTVNAIAKQVGIDEANGDLLPEQKIEHIHRLIEQYHYVGMIGDGVNDAPAMAAASVGIAMGVMGTDTAIETADITLMQDDLSKVAKTISFGRRTVKVIKTNIAFALGVKLIFLTLALLGHTSLWLAILADTGTTLLVIVNALSLLKE